MKNIKKPLISFLMAMVIIFCMVTPTSAASAYDAGKALSYAKTHWNDGKGYCAEFVSDCLKAGGCTVWSTGATTLAKRLKSSSYGTWLELGLV